MKRDDAMDRLLQRTAGATPGARAAEACLDAEVLAAFTDGSLTLAERSAAEAHAAGCDRCFAILSDIVRTAPPAQMPAAQEKAARWLSLRWMLPLASAAVIVLAFVLQQPPSRTPVTPAAPPAPAPAQPIARANENAAAANREQKQEAGQKQQGARAAVPGLAKDSAAAVEPPQRRDEGAALRRKAQAQESAALGAAADKLVAGRQAAVDEVQRKPAAAPAPSAPPPAAAATPATVAEAVAVDRNERVRPDMRALKQQLALLLTTPDPNVRWRVNPRTIERSADGGRTWRSAGTQTDRDLLGGSCPAANVCWFVGRRGLVLLTSDGTNWRTLSPPEASVDLLAITATSEAAAVVTAANGRIYRTTDGGRTWTVD